MAKESLSSGSIEAFVRRDSFIVIQGIEVEIGDFVKIYNGEECFPALSQNELMIEIAKRFPLADDISNKVNLANIDFYFDEASLRKLSIRKFLRLKELIQKEKLETGLKIIEMDRVLAMLSPELMRFDSIVEFVSRYSEPKASEAEIVMASASEVNSGVGHLQCHYLTEHNVQPITSMDAVSLETILIYLGLKIPLTNVPVVLLERVLAGHALSEDEMKKLSLLSNIGSSVPNLIRKRINEAIVGIGVFTVCLATPVFGIVSTREEMLNLVVLGGVTTGVGLLATSLPFGNNSVKLKLKSSIKKYKKIELVLQEAVSALKSTPSGKVRLALLWEVVQHYLKEEKELSEDKVYEFEKSFLAFKTRASLILNHKLLYEFSIFLDSSYDNELSFNEMMVGRELDTREQILQAIIDFKETVSEMAKLSGDEFQNEQQVLIKEESESLV